MIDEGQIVLFNFPQTDQKIGKLRPALVLRRLPGRFDDWLICMISSQLHQQMSELDEVITPENSDFLKSGLKFPSVIRACRLAVVNSEVYLGQLGQIDQERLVNLKEKLAKWISGSLR